jgi:hypothetical protein
MASQSDERSDAAVTEYSNPPNGPSMNCLSPTFQKSHVGRDSQRHNTPITPTTACAPEWSSFPKAHKDGNPQQSTVLFSPSTPFSPWPLKTPERESSVIHLDVYDREKIHMWEPAQKKFSIPKAGFAATTTPGSECGSASSLLVPGQAIYAWNDEARR